MADNGGTIAIRGFNYQKASIILVLLKNFSKEGFSLAPEAGDDFEVHLGSEKIYVQVKGTKKLSLSKLMSRRKKEANSILDKSLAVGERQDCRKIFLWDFEPKEREDMHAVESEKIELTKALYKFSDEQKEKIKTKLELNQDNCIRLENQHIYITPFRNDMNDAIAHLTGVAVGEGFSGEASQVRLLLSELSFTIDQRSEIPVECDISSKMITNEYIKCLFNSFEKDSDFNSVLEILDLNYIQKKDISKAKTKVNLLYGAIKKEVSSKLIKEELITKSEREAIDEIIDMIYEINEKIEKVVAFAIAIECYCEIGDK
ncbi:dsDNA nuclease domain-containing protein [Turicibacter sanguinis]|uniref:dsDNA nuclease domain-containing protein n=1 Tax=Turicibacter sanguinis TaxID=154288 RepID=UPI0006BF5081|nr:dsDNA nuclease domain-containing protein [Turicibacter sanguinis]CUN11127.1 Uncharacterised protein [Turicibacter sanguinis]